MTRAVHVKAPLYLDQLSQHRGHWQGRHTQQEYSRILRNDYQKTRRHIPKDKIIHIYRHYMTLTAIPRYLFGE